MDKTILRHSEKVEDLADEAKAKALKFYDEFFDPLALADGESFQEFIDGILDLIRPEIAKGIKLGERFGKDAVKHKDNQKLTTSIEIDEG